MIRQMRRAKQQLSQEECEEILKSQKRGVLAVLGDDGYPYTVPLDYVYEDGRFYFHVALEGHKLDAIRAYEKCSFCVLDDGVQNEGEWWWYFRSVICFGRAHVVEDEERKVELLWKLGKKYFPPTEDIPDEIRRGKDRVHMIELVVDHMTGKRVQEK